MPHADSSTFREGLSKQETYEQVILEATGLFEDQRNWVCNLANAASLLYHAYHSLPGPSKYVNWAGFYVLDQKHPSQLILGPFMGKVACQTISFGKGVCGTAAEKRQPIRVPDVEQFPGHIACDSASKSEIVVPILKNGATVAIIDIDCGVLEGFDEIDERELVKFAKLLAENCDW